MSCSIISITNIGSKYATPPRPNGSEPGGTRSDSWPCYTTKTCTCGPSTDYPDRTYTIGCRGREGYEITEWLQDIEICYECESENGCTFSYCDNKTLNMGETRVDFPCDALNSDNCKCPNNPNIEIVNSPCE